MDAQIPSADKVREALAPMSYAQLYELERLSGTPFSTLLKIRDGVTSNPRIDTVGQFWPHIVDAAKVAA